jgi:hypothetical protein
MKKTFLVAALALAAFNVFAQSSVEENADRLDPKLLGPKAEAGTLRSLRVLSVEEDFKVITNAVQISKLNAMRAASIAAKKSKVAVSQQALVKEWTCGISMDYSPFEYNSYKVDDGNTQRSYTDIMTNVDVTTSFGTDYSSEAVGVDISLYVYHPSAAEWRWVTVKDNYVSINGGIQVTEGFSIDDGQNGGEFYGRAEIYDTAGKACDKETSSIPLF